MQYRHRRSRGLRWGAALAMVAMAMGSVTWAYSPKATPHVPSRGFTVEIAGTGGKDVDSAWESVSGGALNIEVAESSVGAEGRPAAGYLTVDALTLGRPLAAGQRGAAARENDEMLENGAGKFRVEIDGAPAASANVESITMEDLVIDEREMTTGADWDYRVYGPGDAHYGSITIRSRVARNSKELYQWWLDASQGKNIRKSISVIVLKRDGTEARRYNFTGCSPTRYEPLIMDASGGLSLEGITVACTGVEFAWNSPLAQWLNDTLQGQPWKRMVTVTELMADGRPGRTFHYMDCFPTRYVFPALSASGTGNLYEEVSIKPIRLELSQ